MSKNIKIETAIGIILFVAVLIGGSILVGYKKPQTSLQYASSFVGQGKPDVDAASKIVFFGDSITALENWNVLFGVSGIANAGIPGNTTDDLIARTSQSITARPQKLFLMIGVNDLLRGKDVSYVLKNYRIILDKIQAESPKTMIYVQSVLPVNNDVLKSEVIDIREKINALNVGINLLANEKKIIFIDLYPYFCESDNKLYWKYSWDGLHPNSHGYAVWKDLIAQYIK